MIKQLIFMEEESVDYQNLIKLLDNSGFTDANIIRYKKGAPKPELISVNIDTENTEELKKRTTDELLSKLSRFLKTHVEQFRQMDYERNEQTYTMRYHGTAENFITFFKEFLNKG